MRFYADNVATDIGPLIPFPVGMFPDMIGKNWTGQLVNDNQFQIKPDIVSQVKWLTWLLYFILSRKRKMN